MTYRSSLYGSSAIASKAAFTILALMMVGPAFGQEAAPSVSASSAAELQDIVVTARKRSESLRDVPISITAISGAQLQAKNITQIIDLAATTPNFQFSYGAVQPFTFIRGFGSGANAGFEQSVGKFVNNVSFGRDQDGRIPIFDVERLEVLRGPQVLAFGNSATVGALNITTKKPGDSFEADGSASYEFNSQEVQIQGGVTTPLNESVSFRLAGLFQDLNKGDLYNPLRRKHEPTTRNWAVRPTLRISPSPDFDLTLYGEYAHLRDYGNNVTLIAQSLNPAVPRYTIVDKDIRRVDFSQPPVSSPEFGGMNSAIYQADMNYRALGGTFTSTTAFRRMHSNIQFGIPGGNDSQVYFNQLQQRLKQFSQEVRFSGSYGKLDLTLGAYYQHDMLRMNVVQELQLAGYGRTGVVATPIGRANNYTQQTNNYSAFTDLTYRITDSFSLSAGARYSHIRKIAGQSAFATPIIPNLGFGTDQNDLLSYHDPALDPIMTTITRAQVHTFPFGTFRLKDSFFQPQVIAQYKWDRNQIYAKFVRGDKVGGFDYFFPFATVSPNTVFGPEKAVSLEVGAKGLIFDGQVDYSVAIFRTTYTGLQQAVLSNLVNVISNVGKARTQGVEFDLTWRPASGLRVGFGGSYLDARLIDFPSAPCGSVASFNRPVGCVADLSDTPTQYASKWTGTFSVDYEHPIGNGDYVLGGGVSLLARTKFNAGSYNDPPMVQKGLAQLDAHVDLKPADSWWALSLFGRNLTDYRYLNYAVLSAGNPTGLVGSYARGRQIGLRLSVDLR
jgi:iron complex outermembrane receptor protein